MLSISQAWLLMLGIVIILITPGPTNTLLAAAGLRLGIRRAMPLLICEFAGYLFAIGVWGVVIGHAADVLAWLPAFMRVMCSVYIAYLAVRMWRSAVALRSSSNEEAAGVRGLFVTTLLNPKAMLFAGTLFPSAAFSHLAPYLQSMSLFTLVLVPIGFLWIAFGATLGTGRLAWASPERVQRGASLILGTFSVLLVCTLFH
jgi:threonine/homoserine/homoserine lactone efflux protein